VGNISSKGVVQTGLRKNQNPISKITRAKRAGDNANTTKKSQIITSAV
jgi:hypothetical protein